MISNIYKKLGRITSNHLYFPEIDGIRFLAIILVILFHAHGYFLAKTTVAFTDDPASYSLLERLLSNGDRGVELFFVLSGFILCLPFAKQYINKEKKVQLKKYYLRRLTRLEPPYIIAMTALMVLQLAAHIRPASVVVPSWLASLIYAHGFIFHHTPLLTVVAWSLEIEIQFYILAPLLFRVLLLPVVARRVLLTSAMVAMVLVQAVIPSPEGMLTLFSFVQYFLMGILLADLHVSRYKAVEANSSGMISAALVTLISILFLPIKNSPAALIDPARLLGARLFFPFLIGIFYYLVLNNDLLKKVFSFRFVPVIGGMCYSIYLLHYTIISAFGKVTMQWHITNYYLPNLLLQLTVFLIPILVLSSLFFYFVERPFMAGKWTNMLMGKSKETPNT
jgi:peptidoglycan/LPS O-acetylase OafA/YrhL